MMNIVSVCIFFCEYKLSALPFTVTCYRNNNIVSFTMPLINLCIPNLLVKINFTYKRKEGSLGFLIYWLTRQPMFEQSILKIIVNTNNNKTKSHKKFF